MTKIKTVKGTHDILEEDFFFHDKVQKIFEKYCVKYNFRKISTPIIEFSKLFSRTLGEVSDIVSKEMFTFVDQGGDKITLRPEGTASVSRALISNSLYEDHNQKFFYFGPMFRRERPQSGRLRQFTQIGVEYFNQYSNLCDLEVIFLANSIIQSLGINKKVCLHINSIGNTTSRNKYVVELTKFLEKFKSELSEESQIRLDKNPLRILDSKNIKDKRIIEGAPDIKNFLDFTSKENYEELKENIINSGIDFVENSNLVRGLDYYNDTVFEFVTNVDKGQNTILAGGRYDGLVKVIGGKDICGVGWAAGIERIVNLIKENEKVKKRIICIFSTSKNNNVEIFKTLKALENIDSHSFHPIFHGNLKKKLNKANKLDAEACIIIGDDEFKDNKLIFKNFNTGRQEQVDIKLIFQFLNKQFI